RTFEVTGLQDDLVDSQILDSLFQSAAKQRVVIRDDEFQCVHSTPPPKGIVAYRNIPLLYASIAAETIAVVPDRLFAPSGFLRCRLSALLILGEILDDLHEAANKSLHYGQALFEIGR